MYEEVLTKDKWKDNDIIQNQSHLLEKGLKNDIRVVEKEIEDLKKDIGNPKYIPELVKRDIRFKMNKKAEIENRLTEAQSIDFNMVLSNIENHPEVELLQVTKGNIYILTKPLKFERKMEWSAYQHGERDARFEKHLRADPYVGQFLFKLRGGIGAFIQYFAINLSKRYMGEDDYADEDDLATYPYSHWGITGGEFCEGDWSDLFKAALRKGDYYQFLVSALDYIKSAGAMGAYMDASSFLMNAEEYRDPIDAGDYDTLEEIYKLHSN